MVQGWSSLAVLSLAMIEIMLEVPSPQEAARGTYLKAHT